MNNSYQITHRAAGEVSVLTVRQMPQEILFTIGRVACDHTHIGAIRRVCRFIATRVSTPIRGPTCQGIRSPILVATRLWILDGTLASACSMVRAATHCPIAGLIACDTRPPTLSLTPRHVAFHSERVIR